MSKTHLSLVEGDVSGTNINQVTATEEQRERAARVLQAPYIRYLIDSSPEERYLELGQMTERAEDEAEGSTLAALALLDGTDWMYVEEALAQGPEASIHERTVGIIACQIATFEQPALQQIA